MKQTNWDYQEHETKKEYIMRIAQEDPFLKIEEIAEYARTTQRYVRTILSEANLSLMNLREEYARKMEKNVASRILFSIKDSHGELGLHTRTIPLHFTYSLPQFQMIADSNKLIWNTSHARLFSYTQHMYYEERPSGLITMIVPMELEEQQLNLKLPLCDLLEYRSEKIRRSCPEIEAGKLGDLLEGETELAETGLSPDLFMLKVATFIHEEGYVVGREVVYFPGEFVKLTIPGLFSSPLELTPER